MGSSIIEDKVKKIELLGQGIVASYLLGFLFPFTADIPLIILSSGAILVALFNPPKDNSLLPKHLGGLAVFLILMAIAIAASENVQHSLFTSAPFLPAILIFFMIVRCFHSTKDLFTLYTTLSIVSLVLSLLLLWTGIMTCMEPPGDWIHRLANPLYVVPNDAILFSLIAPFSLVIIFRKPLSVTAAVAAISLLLAVVSVVVLKSRGAFLIMIFSFLSVLFNRFRFQRVLLVAIVVVALMVAMDWLTGFGIFDKVVAIQKETRIPLWIAAWQLFLNHPILGYGPHMFVFEYQAYLPTGAGFVIDNRLTPWAHNLYLELLAEQGLLVMAAFVSLLFFNLSYAWKLTMGNTNKSLAGLGVATSLTGFILAAAIELTFIRVWVVLMFFILLAVIHTLSAQHQEISS